MKKYIKAKSEEMVVQVEPQKCYWTKDGEGKFLFHYGEEPANAVRVKDGYKVVYPDGVTGWIPKSVFEEQYREGNGMSFGMAIEVVKAGERIARAGWNGKDMYVFLAYEADFVTDADISAFDQLEVEVGDMLVMKTAQNTFQPGWLASQADMLADDWYIVE